MCKKVIFIVGIAVLLVSFSFSVKAQITFERWYGGSASDYGIGVQELPGGGYILCGVDSDTAGYGWQACIIKTDSYGNLLWEKTYGDTFSDDALYDVELTSRGNYVFCGQLQNDTLKSDIWIMKTDTAGNTLWSNTYFPWVAWDIDETADGGYIVGGFTDEDKIGYLFRLNSQGDTIWTRAYSNIFILPVEPLPDGNYIFAGIQVVNDTFYVCLGKVDTLGDILWTKTYDIIGVGARLQLTSDNCYAIAAMGIFDEFPGAYLIKTDTTGTILWKKTLNEEVVVDGPPTIGMSETHDGGFILTMPSDSVEPDLLLLRLNENGDSLWARTYGGDSVDFGMYVQETEDKGFIVIGWTESFGVDGDIYLVKTDSLGLGIEEEQTPKRRLKLFSNFPNPFTGCTWIRYVLPQSSDMKLTIYNLCGQRVKTLVSGKIQAGRHQVIWDGTDSSGKRVAPGIYFYRLEAGNFKATEKLILVR
jgi:hypothetical protein